MNMDNIKSIIKQFYPLLLTVSCVLFVLWVFFSAPMFGGNGIFEGGGNLFSPMVGADGITNSGLSNMDGINIQAPPPIKYVSGAKTVGDCADFKDMFMVKKEDDSYVSGSTEDGFALYLMDIRNSAGGSVVERLTTDEIAELEEIPASFIYDTELEQLHFYGGGVFTVYVKVYGINGGQTIYEFNLPVESN